MIDTQEMEKKIEAGIADATAAVRDMDGAGRHYEVVVVTDAFEGKPLIDRHRLVYAALGKVVGDEMHAAKLRTLTRAEAEKE